MDSHRTQKVVFRPSVVIFFQSSLIEKLLSEGGAVGGMNLFLNRLWCTVLNTTPDFLFGSVAYIVISCLEKRETDKFFNF